MTYGSANRGGPRQPRARRPGVASIAMLAMLFIGCDSADSVSEKVLVDGAPAPETYRVASGFTPAPAPVPQAPSIPQRFIRNASANIEVDDLEDAVQALRELTARRGGVIAHSETSSYSDVRSASIVVRVPADSLDAVIADLEPLGDVRSMSVTATDVSREYFDVETRLAVKEETVRRLRQLIDRSGSIEDLVAVERELSRATTELEQLKGQIRYFDANIAQSDVRVQLTEREGRFSVGSLRPILRALGDAVDVFARSVATLVQLIVFLIPWVLVAWLLRPVARRVIRARRERKAES